jgi:hypothetical protein
MRHPSNYSGTTHLSIGGSSSWRLPMVLIRPNAEEHIGGFWILDAANMDEAVAWGRKAVIACRASVEVRQFLAMPTE